MNGASPAVVESDNRPIFVFCIAHERADLRTFDQGMRAQLLWQRVSYFVVFLESDDLALRPVPQAFLDVEIDKQDYNSPNLVLHALFQSVRVELVQGTLFPIHSLVLEPMFEMRVLLLAPLGEVEAIEAYDYSEKLSECEIIGLFDLGLRGQQLDDMMRSSLPRGHQKISLGGREGHTHTIAL